LLASPRMVPSHISWQCRCLSRMQADFCACCQNWPVYMQNQAGRHAAHARTFQVSKKGALRQHASSRKDSARTMVQTAASCVYSTCLRPLCSRCLAWSLVRRKTAPERCPPAHSQMGAHASQAHRNQIQSQRGSEVLWVMFS
jgi:hypothetical protein